MILLMLSVTICFVVVATVSLCTALLSFFFKVA